MSAARKPTASVTAAGVVAIIGCVLVLLGTSIAFVVFLTFPLPTSQAGPALPSFIRKVAAGTMAFFAVVAVLGLFTGIGVLRLKNWARISALIWSGITAVICGLSLVFVVFMPFPTPPNTATPASVTTVIRATTGLFYGVPLVIAIWWLILFNRKAIAAQFLAPGSGLDASGFPGQPTSASPPPLPLPITVLAVFLLMSSVSLFLLFFVHLPVVLFAHSFRGPTGTAVWIATCLLSTVAGIGLLYRKAWSYRLTLALQLLWFLSGIVTLASPKYPDLMHEAISSMALSTATYPEYSIGQLRKFSYTGLAFPVLIGIVLLYYRSRFTQASASSNFMPKAP